LALVRYPSSHFSHRQEMDFNGGKWTLMVGNGCEE
jgi:hypothetical protein